MFEEMKRFCLEKFYAHLWARLNNKREMVTDKAKNRNLFRLCKKHANQPELFERGDQIRKFFDIDFSGWKYLDDLTDKLKSDRIEKRKDDIVDYLEKARREWSKIMDRFMEIHRIKGQIEQGVYDGYKTSGELFQAKIPFLHDEYGPCYRYIVVDYYASDSAHFDEDKYDESIKYIERILTDLEGSRYGSSSVEVADKAVERTVANIKGISNKITRYLDEAYQDMKHFEEFLKPVQLELGGEPISFVLKNVGKSYPNNMRGKYTRRPIEIHVHFKDPARLEDYTTPDRKTVKDYEHRMLTTIEHELMHFAQDRLHDLLPEAPNFQESVGLPPEEMRTDPNRDRSSPYRRQERQEHPKRDIEFYTRLNNEVRDFVRHIEKNNYMIPDKILAEMEAWIQRDRDRVGEKYDQNSYYLQTAKEQGKHTFGTWKEENPEKYAKGVKEFTKEVRDRLDL
jgi:hypothetical protein